LNPWTNNIKNSKRVGSEKTKFLSGLLLDFLFPRSCPACGSPLPIPSDLPLCNSCMAHVEPIDGAICLKCGVPFSSKNSPNHLCSLCIKNKNSLDWIRSFFIYSDPIATLVKRLKYHGDSSCLNALLKLSKPHLIRLMEDIPFGSDGLLHKTCIIPVPLHPKRLKRRLFNQSLLIAKGLFDHVPICLDLVERDIDNPPQTSLSLSERKKNVRGVFKIKKLDGSKNFLLIDDVMTSGSTLNELARTLKNHGARGIAALTIARTV